MNFRQPPSGGYAAYQQYQDGQPYRQPPPPPATPTSPYYSQPLLPQCGPSMPQNYGPAVPNEYGLTMPQNYGQTMTQMCSQPMTQMYGLPMARNPPQPQLDNRQPSQYGQSQFSGQETSRHAQTPQPAAHVQEPPQGGPAPRILLLPRTREIPLVEDFASEIDQIENSIIDVRNIGDDWYDNEYGPIELCQDLSDDELELITSTTSAQYFVRTVRDCADIALEFIQARRDAYHELLADDMPADKAASELRAVYEEAFTAYKSFVSELLNIAQEVRSILLMLWAKAQMYYDRNPVSFLKDWGRVSITCLIICGFSDLHPNHLEFAECFAIGDKRCLEKLSSKHLYQDSPIRLDFSQSRWTEYELMRHESSTSFSPADEVRRWLASLPPPSVLQQAESQEDNLRWYNVSRDNELDDYYDEDFAQDMPGLDYLP